MPRVYDVDEAVLNHRPQVRLRGVLYPMKDMSMADRISSMMDAERRQREIEEGAKDQATLRAGMKKMMGELVQRVLDNVPVEVAEDLTEWEFNALSNVINDVRMNDRVGVIVKEEGVAP